MPGHEAAAELLIAAGADASAANAAGATPLHTAAGKPRLVAILAGAPAARSYGRSPVHTGGSDGALHSGASDGPSPVHTGGSDGALHSGTSGGRSPVHTGGSDGALHSGVSDEPSPVHTGGSDGGIVHPGASDGGGALPASASPHPSPSLPSPPVSLGADSLPTGDAAILAELLGYFLLLNADQPEEITTALAAVRHTIYIYI